MDSEREMEGLAPLEQAKKAIGYALRRIRDEWQIGYHMGYGTQAFALLTEAASTLFGEDLDKVREKFCPRSKTKADTEIAREVQRTWEDYTIQIRRAGDDDSARQMAKALLIDKLESVLNAGREAA
jgi:hypothetical protein